MIGLPPLSAGALKKTLIFVSPAATVGGLGWLGADTNGVTAADGGDWALVPSALVAVTVQV